MDPRLRGDDIQVSARILSVWAWILSVWTWILGDGARFSTEEQQGFAGDQTDDLETRQLMVSEGVRTAHVAGADAKDSDRGRAHAPSITLPSPASSREKSATRI